MVAPQKRKGLVARGVISSAQAIARKPASPAKHRETELNFKLYRQATNKIVGISDGAAAFLSGFF